jgi:hypothetical protein
VGYTAQWMLPNKIKMVPTLDASPDGLGSFSGLLIKADVWPSPDMGYTAYSVGATKQDKGSCLR